MSNRRTHPRLDVLVPVTGSMQFVREVRVVQATAGEMVVIARQPEAIGEALTLSLVTSPAPGPVPVRVVASRPVVVDGGLRHEVRLAVEPASGQDARDGNGGTA